MARKKEDSNSTAKSRIMDAAIKLFAEKGYSATTTREIVKNAGSSLSMLDLCFGSKDKLYAEILHKINDIYVLNSVDIFGKIVDERINGELTKDKSWYYIELITKRLISIVMNPDNYYIIMLLNRELQSKEGFDVNLEPTMMYIYNYQLLFEDYTRSSNGSGWTRALSFEVVTGMFNLLTYPKIMMPFDIDQTYLLNHPLSFEETIKFLEDYELTSIKAMLDKNIR